MHRFILFALLFLAYDCRSQELSTVAADMLRRAVPAEAGFDAEKFACVDSVINGAIGDRAFPGAVLLVAKDGMIVYHKAFGTLGDGYDSHPVDTTTIYDIASLTKVIATTGACMRLVDERRLKLDDPVAAYIPSFAANGKGRITIRNLLHHDSGLPAWKPLYKTCPDPKTVLDSIDATPLSYPTGAMSVYSDLGFIVLGKVIENVTGVRLDRYVDSLFFKPLGMTSTSYNPSPSLAPQIAPTALDSRVNPGPVLYRGKVHDENAAALGGVSGNAGLFSTAIDLAKYLEMLRRGGEYAGRRYLASATIAEFTNKQPGASTRALGWDTRKPDRSWAGSLVSAEAYIHTGFTGTSVVVDPPHGLIVVLLTNRVFPSRENQMISDVRPRVHDAILKALK